MPIGLIIYPTTVATESLIIFSGKDSLYYFGLLGIGVEHMRLEALS